MALWIADEGAGLIRSGADGERRLCAQPLSLCACGNTLVCAQAQQAAVYAADTGAALGRYPLPPGARRMCALPGALYCLSSDADSISLLCPRTGRLLLCAQAGCYPRDLALSPCRRMLAVAGGAAGAVLVYRARELTLIRSLPLPGVVSAAAFAGAELLALCAVDEGRLQSRLFRISIHGVVSALGCWEGLPGALLIHPDGMIVCGVLGKLLLLRPDGRVARCLPCGLPACLRPCPGGLLCADALDGCQRYGIIRRNGFLYLDNGKEIQFRGPGDVERDIKQIAD